MTENTAKKRGKIKIRIPSTEDEKGDVFIAVNGKSYLIQRDVPVEVPSEVVKVLDNAVIETVRPDSKGKLKPVKIQRYPYQKL